MSRTRGHLLQRPFPEIHPRPFSSMTKIPRLFLDRLAGTVCLLLVALPVAAQDSGDSVHLQSFDKAWQLIHDRYWDPDFGGLDWQGVKDELRPRAEKASTHAELRDILGEMIARLGQSHFGVIPGDLGTETEGGGPACAADFGDRLREILDSSGPSGAMADPGFDVQFHRRRGRRQPF